MDDRRKKRQRFEYEVNGAKVIDDVVEYDNGDIVINRTATLPGCVDNITMDIDFGQTKDGE